MNRALTEADIISTCGVLFFQRGQRYFKAGRVRKIEVLNSTEKVIYFRAVTKGSSVEDYRQDIMLFNQDKNGILVEGFCSCPVGSDCKHVAAACLQYIKQVTCHMGVSKPTVTVNDQCLRWLEELEKPQSQLNGDDEFIAYVIYPEGKIEVAQYRLKMYLTRQKRNGEGLIKGKQITARELSRYGFEPYMTSADKEIISFAKTLSKDQGYYYEEALFIDGIAGAQVLKLAALSGRLYFKQHQYAASLSIGDDKAINYTWTILQGGDYQLKNDLDSALWLLPTEPPWYLDENQKCLGVLDSAGLNFSQLKKVFNAPDIPVQHIDEFSRRLVFDHPGIPIPPPKPLDIAELSGIQPVPHLLLFGQELSGDMYIHFLRVRFDYAEHSIAAPEPEAFSLVSRDGAFYRIARDEEAERTAVNQLLDYGFKVTELPGMNELLLFSPGSRSVVDSASRWSRFIDELAPQLLAQGWEIDTDDSFFLDFVETEEWEAEIEPAGNDWFEMGFNISVDNQSLPLLPLITPVLEAYEPDKLPEVLTIPLPEQHRFIKVSSAQVKPFLEILYELYGRIEFNEDGKGVISRFDAAAVAEMEQHSYGIFSIKGGDVLRELGRKLKDFQGIAEIPAPQGLQVQLRDYQQKGLNWLQFLREYGFGGILADDMGLGKTVQTLAHLLVEKNAGRLKKPVLIVAPTSLMSNWRREAEHFAPDLKVLVLQGAERKQRFSEIGAHDVVLTTYPLLPRDEAELRAQSYHYLILDEAQVVKNPKAQAAKVVRRIEAGHRLCLTGTPMENHLGELWAQFDFLMPGFLGDSAAFKKQYRTPIEIHGEYQLRDRLAKRLAPFMLRRTKQDVVDELPGKTEIIRSVALHVKQAALYESIRISMEKKVRDAIVAKGLARSHITILDALLKLRQTCCDPRTLALDEAKKVAQSAKLDLLMEMLPELLEEGRRVLLFSQFTKMLGLIEKELKAKKIAYSKLTGQTRKREEVIEQFKSGAVDVFLISLKAGGVGLNLTEADTVIIYDPWWNPAAESQAMDRAHRIGQDKAVFVYKLVTENTVEEKILALQEKKRALVEGVYKGGRKEEALQLSVEDLSELFS